MQTYKTHATQYDFSVFTPCKRTNGYERTFVFLNTYTYPFYSTELPKVQSKWGRERVSLLHNAVQENYPALISWLTFRPRIDRKLTHSKAKS